MVTQVCNHCFLEKPVTEFNWRCKTLGIRAATCREFKKAQPNAYYNKNQVAVRNRLRRQKANNQATIREYIGWRLARLAFGIFPSVPCTLSYFA